MNDLRKGQDSHNREELKLLSRQHRNRDELQRFAVYSLLHGRNHMSHEIKERIQSLSFHLKGSLEKGLKSLVINCQIFLPDCLVFTCETKGEFDFTSKVTEGLIPCTPLFVLLLSSFCPFSFAYLLSSFSPHFTPF